MSGSDPCQVQTLVRFRPMSGSDPRQVQTHVRFRPSSGSDPRQVQTHVRFRPMSGSDPCQVQTLVRFRPMSGSDPRQVQTHVGFPGGSGTLAVILIHRASGSSSRFVFHYRSSFRYSSGFPENPRNSEVFGLIHTEDIASLLKPMGAVPPDAALQTFTHSQHAILSQQNGRNRTGGVGHI